MKRILKGAAEWKTSACLLYTGLMVIYLFFCTVSNQQQISLVYLWTLLAASLISSLIQGICFSNWIIKKMRYTWRSLLFITLCLPSLSLIAWKAEWFPLGRLESWVSFIVIFFLIFIIATIGFHIYYQAAGRKYDGLIDQYRRQKEEDDKQP